MADQVSASGALRVELESAPAEVPARGANAITLTVVRTDGGGSVDGLSMSMVPFMPAMGHGSPAVPSFSALGGGRYRFENVVLTMPGVWELRTAITDPEPDSVVFDVDID
ncbi:MAG TPA: FixH family protein [Polyangiaceae bacterium]|nr:FixH family protein [Polyangiaceae bacterium]